MRGESGSRLVLADHDVGEGGALLLAFPHDAHVVLPLHGGPLCLAQVVKAAGEDDVQRVNKGVRRRRQFQGRHVSRRLREEDRVPCERLFLQRRVSLPAQSHLLPAASSQGCQHLRGLGRLADMPPFSAEPVVIGAGVYRHLRILSADIHQALPARQDDAVLVPGSRARWPGVCRVCRSGKHGDASRVQEPAPFRMAGVLHAAGVQLLCRNQRPPLRVALDVQKEVHEFWCLQVVDVAVPQQSRLRSTACGRLRSAAAGLFGIRRYGWKLR